MSAPGSSPGVSAQPRTSQGEGGDTGTAASDAQRLSERDELARVLDPRAWWIPTDNPTLALDRQLRRAQAEVMADNALAAGFRRVAEDPEPQGDQIKITYRNYAAWKCERCGSDCWVYGGWLDGPEHEGWPRRAQCVPCGHVQDLPAALRGGEQQ